MLLLVGVVAWGGFPPSHAARSIRRVSVDLQGLTMQPVAPDVSVGDTVVWTNRDIVAHTVTSSTGRWDSGLIEAGATWLHVLQVDDFGEYRCKYHSSMVAQLTRSTR